jgi:hypothetical protein
MARSQNERISEIVPVKENTIKKKLIDKINTLGSDANTTAKELTYLSKSLEVLNKQIKDDTFTGGSGIDDYGKRPALQEVPHVSMPSWNTGKATMGRNSSPAQFGIYTSHYAWSCGVTIYDEKTDPVAHNRWTWCHHYGGSGNGGQWGPWSTGQRNECNNWNGNNCYYNTAGTTAAHFCYSNGADSCGPLGNSNLITGPAAALAVRFWCNTSNQASGIGPIHEYRNEQVETGNCEPTDKYTYLVYQGTTIRLRNRKILPGAVVDYSQKPTINGDTNSYGSLTHNFFRKELAVLNRDSTILDQQGDGGFHFKTKIYKNVPDINLQTDLGLVLNDSTAKTITSRIEDGGHQGRHDAADLLEYSTDARSIYPWTMYNPVGRLEGREGIKIVMVDNGDIYWSVTDVSSHSLHKCTRYTVDGVTDDDYYDYGFLPTYSKVAAMRGYKDQDEYLNENVIGYDRRPEVVDYHVLNDFYGRQTNTANTEHPNGTTRGCSHVAIPSRNNKNVILQTAYYNYGCGMSSWIIDRRFSRWMTAWYQRTTSYGCQWGAFAEEGFVASYARNIHGAEYAYRLYIFRQDLNTGIWQRSEMSRTMSELVPNYTVYPTLIPIY